MPITNRIQFIPMAIFNANNFINPNIWYEILTPMRQPLSGLIFRNFSDTPVLVSFDGVNIHDILYPDTSTDYPFQANSLPVTGVANLAKTGGIYIRADQGNGFFYCIGLTVHST
jgi:hypothetical protein